MVNPAEILALDPEVEDILSMWGKEINTQNVEHYFGAIDSPGLEVVSNSDSPFPLTQSKKPGSGTSNSGSLSALIPVDAVVTNGVNDFGLPTDPKGKKPYEGFSVSKGSEDIYKRGLSAGLDQERATGGVFSFSRIPLLSESLNPKGFSANDCGEAFVGAREAINASAVNTPHTDNGVLGSLDSYQPTQETESQGITPLINHDLTGTREDTRVQEERAGLKGAKRKPQRPIGASEVVDNLVLGMEVSMVEALTVAECTLVGRARGKKFTSEFLQEWGEQSFKNESPFKFEALVLAKGWFQFRFGDKGSADWVLQRNWHIGNIPLLLKKWSPLFDAIKEKTDVFPVWVRAPGLPSFLWTEEVFRTIGNRLGGYLEADMTFLKTKNRAIARILVMLNLSGRLAKKINLLFQDYVYEQILDYEYLPFRCHRCHDYGHMAKACPQSRRRRHFRSSHRGNGSENLQMPLRQNMSDAHDQRDMETEEFVQPIEDEGILFQMDAMGKEKIPQTTGKDKANEVVDAEATVEQVKDIQFTSAGEVSGMQTEPLPIFLHEQNPVKNKTEHENHNEQDMVYEKNINHQSVSPNIETLANSFPSLDISCDKTWPSLQSPVPRPQCPYNLRSLGGKLEEQGSSGGLGMIRPQNNIKNKRGRKSHMSKAKLKAKLDVADGKQYSIPGVLRAAQPFEEDIK